MKKKLFKSKKKKAKKQGKNYFLFKKSKSYPRQLITKNEEF